MNCTTDRGGVHWVRMRLSHPNHFCLSLFVSLLLSSCASTPQTHSLLKDPGSLPRSHEISAVGYLEQSQNYCGPAALAMVANFSGLHTTIPELSPMLFTPAKKGTFQADMLGTARRLGLLAVLIPDLRSVLTEVSADHPIVVFQNLGSSANPIWHYAVIIGFDLNQEVLLLHSGLQPRMKMDLAQFERTWRGAGDWALLVLPPDSLAATSSPSELIVAASALERLSKNAEANRAYRAILNRWPNEVTAWFGLGNTESAMNQWAGAKTAFLRASQLAPKSGAIWSNLAEVYQKLHRKREAQQAREIARSLTGSP